MPTYTYRRADGSIFEMQQRITEPALEVCPETGQAVTRVITGSTGLIFKGSGFYLTDYARKNGSAGSASKPGEKAESKPAEAAPAAPKAPKAKSGD